MMLSLVAVAGAPRAPRNMPAVEIAPGVEMPLAGIGTWQYNASTAEKAVTAFLNLGGTHIDTAIGYNNQEGVGRAIAARTAAGTKRTDLFVVSKIPGGFNESAATAALEQSVSQLFPGNKSAYVDLMLVHFPATWGGEGGKAARQAEWRAMEAFVRAGKAKAIGISHYCRTHLDDVLEIATIRPAVNQVQYHVGMGTAGPNATDDIAYMRSHGVTYESFSPLCGPCDGSDHLELITGHLVTSIGAKYGKTGPQVALKWQVQQGIPVIPKSSNPKHIAENLDLFSWTLADNDMAALTAATKPAVAGGGGVSGDCSVA